MPIIREPNTWWLQVFISLAIALGCGLIVDVLVVFVPNTQVHGVRLVYLIVLALALAAILLIFLALLRKPTTKNAAAIKVGDVEIKAPGESIMTPLIMAGILNAVVKQLQVAETVQQTQGQLLQGMNEQERQLAVLQTDLAKVAADIRTIDNRNLRIQLLLAAVTTLIGFSGSVVLMALTTTPGR